MATEKRPRGPIGRAPATGYCRRHLHFSGDESRQLRQEEEEDEDAAEDGNCEVGGGGGVEGGAKEGEKKSYNQHL